MTPEFDVIVVTTNREPVLPKVTYSVERGAYPTDRVRRTIVRNLEGCVTLGGWRTICPGHNAGWVRAANAGLSLSTAPYVVLCNDDIEVGTVNWLEKLREPFLNQYGVKIAAVGPRSTPNQGPQGMLREDQWPGGWGQAPCDPSHPWGIGQWPLSFFCVMLSQEAIRDVGLLDLNLADGYGGDDDDWQRRAWERGWRFAYQPEVMVAHEGNATFKERKGPLQQKNLEYLRGKWGRG